MQRVAKGAEDISWLPDFQRNTAKPMALMWQKPMGILLNIGESVLRINP